MKKSLIAMTSITYAMKAKNLLNSLKYYCEIQRTPKGLGTGCGYSPHPHKKEPPYLKKSAYHSET